MSVEDSRMYLGDDKGFKFVRDMDRAELLQVIECLEGEVSSLNSNNKQYLNLASLSALKG